MKYIIVCKGNAKSLSEAVSELLKQGWNLYGNPFSDSTEQETFLCQAMVKAE